MTPFVHDPDFTLWHGDCLDVLRELPSASVHCCVTSPPYWGLRDYGTGTWDGGDPECDHARQSAVSRASSGLDGATTTQGGTYAYKDVCGRCGATRVDQQLGLESTPDEYVARMVNVFREVRRVLRDDGTLWLNLGSSYMASGERKTGRNDTDRETPGGRGGSFRGGVRTTLGRDDAGASCQTPSRLPARVPACGSDDTELQGWTALDSACRDLCDECLADYLNHRDHTADTSHLPSLDAQPLAPTVRDTEPADSSPASPDASPPDVQESTTIESWRRLRGSCSRCDSRASSLSAVRSSVADAPASGHMSWLNYTSRLKAKDMVPIPWMVAFALQADGWYLRSDVIWSKSNPMPESVTDRPTKAHEYVFLLTKSARYFFDQEAVREPAEWARWGDQTNGKHEGSGSAAGWIGSKTKAELRRRSTQGSSGIGSQHKREAFGHDTSASTLGANYGAAGRNVRSVWEIATQPYAEAHFATFPQELARRCIAAGSPLGGTVLDPFMGSGTTALVARNLGRKSIGIELNADYCALAAKRLSQQSLLAGDAA